MDKFINVALPKGRLGEKVYEFFEKAGYECPSIKEVNRKLDVGRRIGTDFAFDCKIAVKADLTELLKILREGYLTCSERYFEVGSAVLYGV